MLQRVSICVIILCNEAWIDTELEADMEEVLEVVVLGRACRNAANTRTVSRSERCMLRQKRLFQNSIPHYR
jgi:hypothetical protein